MFIEKEDLSIKELLKKFNEEYLNQVGKVCPCCEHEENCSFCEGYGKITPRKYNEHMKYLKNYM